MSRLRSRTSLASDGTLTVEGLTSEFYHGVVLDKSVCNDSLGRDTEHALKIDHQRWLVTPLNGLLDQMPYRYYQYSGYPPGYYQGVTLEHLDMGPGMLDPVTHTLAKTNPSRPVYNLPAFIGELKDLPGLFKSLGNTMLKQGANAFLSYQFGWKPLINDVKAALDFSSSLDARVNEWNRLYSGQGLKRRIKLGTITREEKQSAKVVESLKAVVICDHNIRTQRRSWATIRWKQGMGAKPPSTEADYQRLAQAALGAGVNGFLQAAWQLMPWSWMADWFGNIDEFIAAHDGTIPTEHGAVNVMTNTVSTHTFKPSYAPDWITGGGATASLETKERYQGSTPSISARIPLLSGTQLSILGSLAIQRIPNHVLRGLHF